MFNHADESIQFRATGCSVYSDDTIQFKTAMVFNLLAPGRNDQIGLSKNREKRFSRKRQTTMNRNNTNYLKDSRSVDLESYYG